MACTACAGSWPLQTHLIAELGLTDAYLHDDQFFPGWTVLVLKRHATELFDLTRDERGRLIEELAEIALALDVTFEPVKLNYELLGNQLPHIHWHIIPRLAGDPAPCDAVWTVSHAPKRLTDDELRERIALIRAQIEV